MAKRIYNTAAWQRTRRIKLARQPLCEWCERDGRVVAAGHVDHIVSMDQGGAALDLANLQALCASCHNRKTAAMDGGFGNPRRDRMPVKGCFPDGSPRDPEHPWYTGGPEAA